MFDVPPPLQSNGMNEYKKTWDLFFKYHKPSQAFDIEQLAITAGEDVAFAHAIMRCGAGPRRASFRSGLQSDCGRSMATGVSRMSIIPSRRPTSAFRGRPFGLAND